jgi:hypothetical protein
MRGRGKKERGTGRKRLRQRKRDTNNRHVGDRVGKREREKKGERD